MNKVDGLHHLAITTADIKAQIDFFNDKLGMELVALYWMHGVENTFHGFMRLNDESAIAFVQNPDIGEIPVRIGETHAGNPGANSCSRRHAARGAPGEGQGRTAGDARPAAFEGGAGNGPAGSRHV